MPRGFQGSEGGEESQHSFPQGVLVKKELGKRGGCLRSGVNRQLSFFKWRFQCVCEAAQNVPKGRLDAEKEG